MNSETATGPFPQSLIAKIVDQRTDPLATGRIYCYFPALDSSHWCINATKLEFPRENDLVVITRFNHELFIATAILRAIDDLYQSNDDTKGEYSYQDVLHRTTNLGSSIEFNDQNGGFLIWDGNSKSFIKCTPDGDHSQLVTGNSYIVIQQDSVLHVWGNVTINVNGNVVENIDGDKTTNVARNYTVNADHIILNGGRIDLNP